MPDITRFGARLTADLAAADKVPSRTSVFSIRPAIQADFWARLGMHPDARLTSTLNEHANQSALYRPKEYFRMSTRLAGASVLYTPSSFGAGDRARYYFAFRTGPYAHGLGVIAGIVPQTSGQNQNSYVRLDIYSTASMSPVVVSTTLTYGAHPTGTAGTNEGWQHLKQVMAYVDGLSADTEYYGVFTDVNYGRLQSACVFELTTLSENGGYLATNVTTRSAILSTHRQYAAEVSNAVLQKSAATVWCWTVDDGTAPVTRSSATAANVLDTSITAVATSSPGATLDMTGKSRLSQTTSGVPVVMKVCAKSTVSPAGPGIVKLVDSTGATVMQVSGGWTNAPTWQSVTGFLPASAAKYDLMLSSNGVATLSVYAVSIYQYG